MQVTAIVKVVIVTMMSSSFLQTFASIRGPCFPKHGPAHLTVLKIFFKCNGKHSFKIVHFYDWQVLPQTRPSSSHGITNFFIVMARNLSRTFTSMTGPCSLKHDTTNHTMLNCIFILMLSSLSRSLTYMTGPCSPKHGPAHLTL